MHFYNQVSTNNIKKTNRDMGKLTEVISLMLDLTSDIDDLSSERLDLFMLEADLCSLRLLEDFTSLRLLVEWEDCCDRFNWLLLLLLLLLKC